MVGRSDLFRHISVYVDSVVVTFRGVVESFIAVWTFVGLFPGAVDKMENPRHLKGRAWVSETLDGIARTEEFRASLVSPCSRSPSCRIYIHCFWKVKQV